MPFNNRIPAIYQKICNFVDKKRLKMIEKEEIRRLIARGNLADATALLKASPDDAWALYMLGRIAWKEGRKADAISLYERAQAIDPASEAAVALEQAREIMNFYNTDLYNP